MPQRKSERYGMILSPVHELRLAAARWHSAGPGAGRRRGETLWGVRTNRRAMGVTLHEPTHLDLTSSRW